MAVFRDLGRASMGSEEEDMLATIHPTVPLYLAHSTPHGFSLPRIRIQMVDQSPKLPANKHPKFPGRVARPDPLQEQEEGEHIRRGASRALANSAHLQAALESPAAALEEKGEESGWCWGGEDEIRIWDHGKAQVSLLASLGFHSFLGRTVLEGTTPLSQQYKLQHLLQSTNFPGTNSWLCVPHPGRCAKSREKQNSSHQQPGIATFILLSTPEINLSLKGFFRRRKGSLLLNSHQTTSP